MGVLQTMVNYREIISVLFMEVYWTKYWNMNLCMAKHYCNPINFTFANTIFNPNVHTPLITKNIYNGIELIL